VSPPDRTTSSPPSATTPAAATAAAAKAEQPEQLYADVGGSHHSMALAVLVTCFFLTNRDTICRCRLLGGR